MVGWSYLNDERKRRDRPSQGLRLELARVGSKAMRLEAASPMGDGLSHQTLQRMGEQKYHEASLGCELKVVPSAVVRVGPQVVALFGQKEVRE